MLAFAPLVLATALQAQATAVLTLATAVLTLASAVLAWVLGSSAILAISDQARQTGI